MSDGIVIAIITVCGVMITAICAVVGPILLAITTQAINERNEAKQTAKVTAEAMQKQIDAQGRQLEAQDQKLTALERRLRGRR